MEGESRNAGASLGEQNMEGMWCHANYQERHSAKTISHHQWVSHDSQNANKLQLSERQTIHISYCSLRHWLPSVYSSFNKPMSHAAYFWVQVISHFKFVPGGAGLETRAEAGAGAVFGYSVPRAGLGLMISCWEALKQCLPCPFCILDSKVFRNTGPHSCHWFRCWAPCLGISNWIISLYCWGFPYTTFIKNDHLASSSLSAMNSQERRSWLSLHPTDRSQGFWAIRRGARHICVAEGSARVWDSSAFLAHGRRFFHRKQQVWRKEKRPLASTVVSKSRRKMVFLERQSAFKSSEGAKNFSELTTA